MTALEAQPLYIKAREKMVSRLISGEWKPGQMLPSEFAIADELGVSQGTIRKALDDMTARGLLIRRQGRGTFVAEAEDESILFRFYRLTPDDEEPADAAETNVSFPQSINLSRTRAPATSEEQSIFNIKPEEEVWRFERIRNRQNQPLLWEQLVLPCSCFPELCEETALPNNVYQFYSVRYGIIVARVKEQLRAVAAPADVAQLLGLPPGEPLLRIDRQAIALDEKTVEWRTSLCRSDTMHYRNELT